MIFVYVGIVLVVFALAAFLRQDLAFARGVRHVRAVVFDHTRQTDEGSSLYAPMARFTTEAGEDVEITDGVFGLRPRPPVGAHVDLVYPAGKPHLARVRRPLLRALIYLFLLATLFVLAGRALGWLPAGADTGPVGL